MDYQEILESEYCGKIVTTDLDELSEENVEFEWDGSFDEDTGVSSGEGHINLDYRDYLSEEDDESGEEASEEDFDERENWRLQTGVSFVINEDGEIESIEITAEVSCFGDSSLGDCDPYEEWCDNDLALAREFFDTITN